MAPVLSTAWKAIPAAPFGEGSEAAESSSTTAADVMPILVAL